MRKKLVLLVASLAMLLASTVALAQTQPGDADEVRCSLPEECGPVAGDELLCFLPEGCDTDGDGVPELRAGEPVPGEDAGPGAVQYENAL